MICKSKSKFFPEGVGCSTEHKTQEIKAKGIGGLGIHLPEIDKSYLPLSGVIFESITHLSGKA